ncbi:24383_t:CDS:2 [Cetraspora pellucida]|uniref:24383_t:CDS:1 n=1 Tax=Cetraspora pellucida TaxID=1433469 RepID=A0A9N8Z073_9GLOM|nr:24383_t:CDS:2 [Cetraspora pellucida]
MYQCVSMYQYISISENQNIRHQGIRRDDKLFATWVVMPLDDPIKSPHYSKFESDMSFCMIEKIRLCQSLNVYQMFFD